MRLVLITGMSGSGKSVALNVLEDAGFFCVDNLPVPLLPQLVGHLRDAGYSKVAIAVDVRSGKSMTALPPMLGVLRNGTQMQTLFLDARDETLIARFSETRRRHPLGNDQTSLGEAIRRERDMLAPIVALGHRIDTSDLPSAVLRKWVRELVQIDEGSGLTLMFESFGYKHGIPLDADLVFDVRCLPNPFYDPVLRPQTGYDPPVIDFLERSADVLRMRDDIARFVRDWLPCYVKDSRSYLTVAIGCTGGQHRSVYLAQWLADHFRSAARVLLRHRSLDASSK
ncbi:RNase adapter RapZ [Methyloversatilis thermotolerans]|uniref:RNase adapter RapZ n=1 Tax=Methyloversatilis thermotolerans TaxID=1346290 RepID=UPI0003A9FFB6|nr:RNase adapter RapZ [Methyloversatilis thermotolerans]